MEAVTIISKDPSFQTMSSRILQDHFRTVSFGDFKPALDYIYNDTPSLVVIEIPKGSPPANYLGNQQSKLGEVLLSTTHPEAKQLKLSVRFAIEH